MSRPILWALGAAGALLLASTFASERLANLSSGRLPAAVPDAVQARPRDPILAAARPISQPSPGGRTFTVPSDPSGDFRVEAAIDGRRIPMLVDTGASIVALTAEDAALAGVRPFPSDFRERVATANGEVLVATVRLREVRVGDIVVHDVDAVVIPAGRLGMSLLGMSFLRRLGGFEVAGGRLSLRG